MGNYMEKESMSRPFAVFDIDGTLIRWQLYHAIADHLVKLGYIDSEAFQEIRNARMVWKRREYSESFRDYELRLVQLFTNVMLQLSVAQFEEAAQSVFDEYKDQVYTYTRDLIKSLKQKGYLIFAISGSQETIIQKMADCYGFDAFVGRVDEQTNGRFTGKSSTPIFAKDAALQKILSGHNVTFEGSIGVGDSHSDIKMLEMVESPIAFNPEKRLFEHAQAQGWKVVIERKNMVYELEAGQEGYELIKTTA